MRHPVGRSAVAGQGDAAASGLWIQHRPDGRRVAVDLVGERLEHGVVGAADQLAVPGGDAVEGAVAQPDCAVDVLVGLVAAGGQRLADRGKDLIGVAVGRGVAGRLGAEVRAEGVRKIAAFTSEATPLDSVEQYVERALSFNPRRNRELLRRSLLHNLRRMPDGRFMWKYDQRHRGRALDPAMVTRRREMLWSAVDGVTCPTLVVRGAQSDVFHDEDAERLAGRFRQGRWVKIEGAGHTVQGDNPAGLLVELRKFLAEVTG